MKELLEKIIKELVDSPDDASVTEVDSENAIVYEVRVGDGDVGKVIGRHGRTAIALRTIVSAITAKQGGKRAMMEIVEDNGEET
ncbi:MAG: RNA-binding protein [Candidatus Marinimicrobia bacterium]|nr:RNA-binding protein [Candidatus Neomarinimicrobiota bacterium]|tara:strand:- start:17078 stop:17329 length:252 start_codon:yes stop_codon:yes gene_type:complete